MNFDPIVAQSDPKTKNNLNYYRNLEDRITDFAIYGRAAEKDEHCSISETILQHYKVDNVVALSVPQIQEIWRFAKGLNEVGGLWMVFHGFRRFVADWMDLTDKTAVDINEFWINETDLILQTDR